MIVFGPMGCSDSKPTSADPVRPVKTMLVTDGQEARVRSFPGVVEATRRAQLAFQVNGLLVELPITEGQRLSEGELIGQLRREEFQARLDSLQGQLDQARARLAALRAGERREERLRREANVRAAEAKLENARIELNRQARLLQTRNTPQSEYDRVATLYRVAKEEHKAAVQMLEKGAMGRQEDIDGAEAQVRGLEAQVVEASLQLADTTLKAPFDGVIAKRFVEPNQNVQAKQPIVEFQDSEEIDIAVDVPETIMVADIQRADILSLNAEVSGAPGLVFPVRIREISQVADPTTQTFRVRVAMEAPEGIRILPGMTSTVTATYRRASVLGSPTLVPVEAVSRTPNGEQVAWVLSPEGTVSPRTVELGSPRGNQVEIRSGLEPGERIVIAGVRFLRDGMQVRDLGDGLGRRGE